MDDNQTDIANEEQALESAPTRSGLDLTQPFSWQATEGRQVSRGVVWYVMLGVISIGLMALAIFIFKSITFAILLVVIDIAVIVLTGNMESYRLGMIISMCIPILAII